MDIWLVIESWLCYWIVYALSGFILTYSCDKLGYRYYKKPEDFATTIFAGFVCSLLSSLLVWILFPEIIVFRNLNIILKYLGSTIVADAWFYHTHRILHYPILFKRFHSKHHSMKYPFALYALYAGSFEIMFSTVPAASIGVLLFNMTKLETLIWISIVSINTTSSHSGLNFLSRAHDLHHKNYKVNFGTMGFFDMVYGTYK